MMIRIAVAAALVALSAPAQAQIKASATIDAAAPGTRIAPEIQGQFAEQLGTGINGGIWVGEDSPIPNIHGYRKDVVEALQALHVPLIRWPGGCYGDIYHWRDGIGPRAGRPVTLNKWWGNVEEHNQFGTQEFFDFAELIGAKTFLNVNVGSATPSEARDWIEYVSYAGHSRLADERRANGRDHPWKIDYVGVGNEPFGCGGNLTPEEFAPIYRRFATFIQDGSGPKLIAPGPSDTQYHWTEVLMDTSRHQLDDISLHYYTLPTGSWSKKGSAIGFPESEWASTFTRTRAIDEMIREHDARMTKYDPDKKLGLFVDEWGTWYDPTPGTNSAYLVQENTLRDALVAAINLDIFQRHADRVHGANIAQMINVLQSMIETDGAKMMVTPTYWTFMLYRPFQGAMALPVQLQSPDYVTGDLRQPALDVSAARTSDGKIVVALVNIDPHNAAEVSLPGIGHVALSGQERIPVPGTRGGKAVGIALPRIMSADISGQVLTAPAMDSRNSYANPAAVRPVPFDGARWRGDMLSVIVPAKSLVVLVIG